MSHITSKLYDKLKIKKGKGSEVEITGLIPEETVAHHMEHIVEEMRKDFLAPGFRKGQVPLSIFKNHINELAVLEEAVQVALNDAYPEIVKDEKIDIFGKPKITLTKLAPKNPVEFKINVGVIPEIKLPDYKKIAKKIVDEEGEITVTEAEMKEVMDQVKKLHAASKKEESKTASTKEEELENLELTDDFVKGLGSFKNVEEFKEKIKENLKLEKESTAWKKKREKILKNLVDNAKVELPQIVVDDEAEAVSQRFHENLEQRKMSKEEYLKKVGKTEEDLKKEDLSYIEHELKIRLILDKIAILENITVTDEEIEKELEYMQSRHPEADPERLKQYIESILRNEKVLRLIEGREIKEEAK